MRKDILSVVLSILIVVGIVGCGGEKQLQQNNAQSMGINVLAAVSLKDALQEIQQNYQTQNPGIKIIYNFGASGTLQKQIEQGAPADIFIAAAAKQMNELEGKNLIRKQTRIDLLKNKLVLVTPLNSKIDKFEDLDTAQVGNFSMGEPGVVPAGQYASQVLEKLKIWEKVKAKGVLAKDVRTVLTYVETGNVEAGIVYKTDALSSRKVRIVAVAAENTHQPIVYPAAILANTMQAKSAQDFLAYLSSNESKAIFEKYGFGVN